MSVTKKTRLLVLTRDNWACVVCGRNLAREVLDGYGYSIHHRRNRGIGGTSRADANQPANLLTTCGDGVRKCHGRITNEPRWARDLGLTLRQNQTPSAVPVWTYSHGWVLLDDEGGWTEAIAATTAPEETV